MSYELNIKNATKTNKNIMQICLGIYYSYSFVNITYILTRFINMNNVSGLQLEYDKYRFK